MPNENTLRSLIRELVSGMARGASFSWYYWYCLVCLHFQYRKENGLDAGLEEEAEYAYAVGIAEIGDKLSALTGETDNLPDTSDTMNSFLDQVGVITYP